MPSKELRQKKEGNNLFVWIWLPDRTHPVVAGRIFARSDGIIGFLYGESYRGLRGAIPIYLPELPLQAGAQYPFGSLKMASCIRDASPDAWGRRVIINRLTGTPGKKTEGVDFDEITYLRESGTDRSGAIDFQNSATDYVPRESINAPIEELLEAAARVENGIPLTLELDRALNHGTSIGGARPKALVVDAGVKYIAKFSAQNDTYSVVRAEFLSMRLAAFAGLNVAPVRIIKSANKEVLLVERFDRVATNEGWSRRSMVSALTMQGLDEMDARYDASYENLAEIMRRRFINPTDETRELFRRIVFNVLCGNTDDHARNHAAFWNGNDLRLTPAYDLCPQPRTGGEANQAMKIHGGDRRSRIATCLSAAGIYGVSHVEALEIVRTQMNTIRTEWRRVADEAQLSRIDRGLLAGRAFLNPYAFEELDGLDESLSRLAGDIVSFMRSF